jgi:predicted nicotinamide N-methyase
MSLLRPRECACISSKELNLQKSICHVCVTLDNPRANMFWYIIYFVVGTLSYTTSFSIDSSSTESLSKGLLNSELRRSFLFPLILGNSSSPIRPYSTNKSIVLGWSEERRQEHIVSAKGDEKHNQKHDVGISRAGQSSGSYGATISWAADSSDLNGSSGIATNKSVSVALPAIPSSEVDTLGSSLWPSALAAAILSQSPSLRHCWQGDEELLRKPRGGSSHQRKSTRKGYRVMELGAGLGLLGWTIAATSRGSRSEVILTDNDQKLVHLLQDLALDDYVPGSIVSAYMLDWRDEVPISSLPNTNNGIKNTDDFEAVTFDAIVGSDVAYYSFLVRPLLNTIQKYLKKEHSMVLLIGQANRASLWDAYHQICEGGYNQRTDNYEAPFVGETTMLLYMLGMECWRSRVADDANCLDERLQVNHDSIEQYVPIGVIVHRNPGCSVPATLTDYDIVATKDIERRIDKSF